MAQQDNVKGVLLDFDGTLVTLGTDYHAMRKAVREILHSHGLRLGEGALLDSLALLRAQSETSEESKCIAQAYEELGRQEWRARWESRALQGSRSFCASLLRSKFPWAIVSNNGRGIIDFCLRRFGFSAPSALVAREDVSDPKPHPAAAELALARLGIKPSAALLVGDSSIDRTVGESLGIETWIIPSEEKSGRKRQLQTLRSRLGIVR